MLLSLSIYNETMKRILITALLISASLLAAAQENTPEYDSTLARKLGADERGMKSYILVILKTGPAKIEDKELVVQECQEED